MERATRWWKVGLLSVALLTLVVIAVALSPIVNWLERKLIRW